MKRSIDWNHFHSIGNILNYQRENMRDLQMGRVCVKWVIHR